MQIKGRVLFAVISLVFAASALALVRHSRRERARTDFSMTRGLEPAMVGYTSRLGAEAQIDRWYLVQGEANEIAAQLGREAPNLVRAPSHFYKDVIVLQSAGYNLNVFTGDKSSLKMLGDRPTTESKAHIDFDQPWCIVVVGEATGKEYLPDGLLHSIWKVH